jgi:hypothetical protein
LPFLFFLQHDIVPSLQQFALSQQAAEFWLLFCGLKVRAAAEIERAAPQARATTSTLILFMFKSPVEESRNAGFGGCRNDSDGAVNEQADF